MKNLYRYTGLLIVCCLPGFISCEYEFPEVPVTFSPGTASFERYVHIGGTLSSGMMNGALYSGGQQNSPAAMLGRQFMLAGGGGFSQAGIGSENGFNEFAQPGPGVSGRFTYSFPASGLTEPEIFTLPGEPLTDFQGDRSALNDFGIPFLKSFELSDPFLAEKNEYFSRIAVDPGAVSLLEQCTALDPTFFTLWIGVDDVISYALSGGQGDPSPPPSSVGINDITPAEVFESALDEALDALLANPQVKGAVANIPNLNDLTYFFIHPYNMLRLTNASIAEARDQFYDAYNHAVMVNNQTPDAEFRPFIDFRDNGLLNLYPQPLIVIDDSLGNATYPDGITPLPKYRQLEPDELLLYSLPVGELSSGLGWLDPLPEKYYLSRSQIHQIQVGINACNAAILEAVESSSGRLVLVDIHALFNKYARHSRINAWGTPESTDVIYSDGVPVFLDLSLHGVISLDGIYPNSRGNALIANEFIHAINQGFGASIPMIDINTFVGNTVMLD